MDPTRRRTVANSRSEEVLMGESPALRDDFTSRTMRRRSGLLNTSLQKSIQLLDEAVGSPRPSQKLRRTPGQLRHTSYTPKQVSSSSKFDVSDTLGATPGRSLSVTPGSFSQMSRFAGLDSTSYAALPVFSPLRSASAMEVSLPGGVTEDTTTTNVHLLLAEDPGISASSGLYAEFQQCFRDHPSEHQIFELIKEYEGSIGDQVKMLQKLVKRATPGQNKFSNIVGTLELLDQERSTWRLIGSLYMDRLETELKEKDDEEDMLIDQLTKNLSEKQTMQALFQREAGIRQAQIVIDWLEANARDQLGSYYNKVEFFADKCAAWENTLHALQQKSAGVPSNYDRPIVDEMDPDAPIRQHRPLADLDREDDVRLLKYVFVHIRSGLLDEAERLCTRCGQAWRAATLEGWKLHNDPNYESGSGGDSIEGNPYRDIWKTVCWNMAHEEKFHLYEKAIYAVLSGNLHQLLPACESWEDFLWAYFKVMVDARVEQEIRMNVIYNRSLQDLPDEYWGQLSSLEHIFQEIQACPQDRVRDEARQKLHIIQKFIILGDTEGLVEEMYCWIKDDQYPPPQHLVRFMAHLVLFLRTIGHVVKEELCVAILETYVRDLIETKQTELVATYVATLPSDLQIEWYAKFLEGIVEKDQRQHCLELAEEVALDVPSITKLVVENIRECGAVEFSIDTESALEASISREDQQKIEAIDWLVFDPTQRAEALRQANAVTRIFLAFKKHAAAREVFNKIPPGSIDVIIKNCQQQTGLTDLPPEDDNAIREYLCVQAYLDASDSFNDWFHHYHHAKPSQPELLPGSNFQERVAFEHREKQYHSELDRWKHSLDLQTKATVDRIYNVLLFVDGGWMVDQKEETEPDESRLHQMSLLRQLCLPHMCFLLHSVLHTNEQYKECVQLSDIIASEQYQLYKAFRKDELQKFLRMVRDSSIALLDDNKDPLGYNLNK